MFKSWWHFLLAPCWRAALQATNRHSSAIIGNKWAKIIIKKIIILNVLLVFLCLCDYVYIAFLFQFTLLTGSFVYLHLDKLRQRGKWGQRKWRRPVLLQPTLFHSTLGVRAPPTQLLSALIMLASISYWNTFKTGWLFPNPSTKIQQTHTEGCLICWYSFQSRNESMQSQANDIWWFGHRSQRGKT